MKTFLNQIDSSNFTENDKMILDYFIQHKNHLPYLSLSDICKDLYLSNATIVRFCQKLGFKGFNELKFTLRNELHSSSDFSNSWKILQRRTAVLKDFIDNIDAVKIKDICSEIMRNKSIYIYGRNMSSLPENATLIIFTNYGEASIYQSIIDSCHQRHANIIWISSSEINPSLLTDSDTYIWTQEVPLEHVHLRTKMTSFLVVQLIVEYLRHHTKKCLRHFNSPAPQS